MSAFRLMLMLPVATLVATCAAAQQVTLDPFTTPINDHRRRDRRQLQ